jgi:hypothetical protein
MKFYRSMMWKVLSLLNLDAPVKLLRNSGLTDEGWFNSYRKKLPVDRRGNPIPWCTYPFIHFIESRLRPDFRVFEYGGDIRRFGMHKGSEK